MIESKGGIYPFGVDRAIADTNFATGRIEQEKLRDELYSMSKHGIDYAVKKTILHARPRPELLCYEVTIHDPNVKEVCSGFISANLFHVLIRKRHDEPPRRDDDE